MGEEWRTHRRRDGTVTGRWHIKLKGLDDKWHYEATPYKRKSQRPEAARLAHERTVQIERQRAGLEPLERNPLGWTVRDLMTWWLEHHSSQLAAHKDNTYSVRAHFFEGAFSALPVEHVTPGRVEQLLREKAKGRAAATVNRLRSFLQSAFSAALREEQIYGENPVTKVRRRKEERKLIEPYRREDIAQLLEAIPEDERALFAAAIYTGMRKGELLGARKADVDLERRTIAVRRSYARGTTKGGKAELVPIHADLVPLLEAALRTPGPLLFPGRGGAMQTRNTKLRERLRGCARAAGLPERRFHDLRHTCATLLLEAGASLASVQRILRHSTPVLTANTYGHLAQTHLAEEMARLSIPPAPGAPEPLEREAEVVEMAQLRSSYAASKARRAKKGGPKS